MSTVSSPSQSRVVTLRQMSRMRAHHSEARVLWSSCAELAALKWSSLFIQPGSDLSLVGYTSLCTWWIKWWLKIHVCWLTITWNFYYFLGGGGEHPSFPGIYVFYPETSSLHPSITFHAIPSHFSRKPFPCPPHSSSLTAAFHVTSIRIGPQLRTVPSTGPKLATLLRADHSATSLTRALWGLFCGLLWLVQTPGLPRLPRPI